MRKKAQRPLLSMEKKRRRPQTVMDVLLPLADLVKANSETARVRAINGTDKLNEMLAQLNRIEAQQKDHAARAAAGYKRLDQIEQAIRDLVVADKDSRLNGRAGISELRAKMDLIHKSVDIMATAKSEPQCPPAIRQTTIETVTEWPGA